MHGRSGRVGSAKLKQAVAVGLTTAALGLAHTGGPAAAAGLLIGADENRPAALQAARTLCRALDLADDPRLPDGSCAPTANPGPLTNLERVSVGALDIALIPSDWLHHAVNRSGPLAFVDIPFHELRTLFLLSAEPLSLLARQEADIAGLDDLEGRRIDIGAPGSRVRALMDAVMAAAGWRRDDFAVVEELPEAERSLAFCYERIEATVFEGSHPDRRVADLMARCGAVLVPVSGPAVAALLAERPYLVATSLSAGTYPGQDQAVASFGPRLTAVASADLDKETVAAVVAAVIGGLDMLRTAHPAFRDLDVEDMSGNGLSAPLHEGAMDGYAQEQEPN